MKMVLAKHRRRLVDAVGKNIAPLVVRLVRVSPRDLDDDNLTSAFKSVRDGIAECIGVDDRDPRVVFVADAQRGAPKQHAIAMEFYCP
ncbi:MAG: hypothetical protein DI536_28835 [Archangium gephyra]|uniref:Uncharacterized protein n=1 Tax=Archangium gephyra TaxID=48 RepID=A0A2W5T6H3_9BACT|nr:MAG: hypothetical protein DI536_28835 [Archangium gephyra]